MILPKAIRHLLDVNVLAALQDEDHIHHAVTTKWFDIPGLEWAICPFSEAGFLRYMTRPSTGDLPMKEAAAMLAQLAQEPGYHYQPISFDWQTLCAPFADRLFGHNQVTDAFLLGLALRHGLVLVTFDRAMLHLAGEHSSQVLILGAEPLH